MSYKKRIKLQRMALNVAAYLLCVFAALALLVAFMFGDSIEGQTLCLACFASMGAAIYLFAKIDRI